MGETPKQFNTEKECKISEYARKRTCDLSRLREVLGGVNNVPYKSGAYDVESAHENERNIMRSMKPYVAVGAVDRKEFNDESFVPDQSYYKAAELAVLHSSKFDNSTNIWFATLRSIITDMANDMPWDEISGSYTHEQVFEAEGVCNFLLAFLRVINVVPDLLDPSKSLNLENCSIKLVFGTTIVTEDMEDGVPDERYAYIVACKDPDDDKDYDYDGKKIPAGGRTPNEVYCELYPDDCIDGVPIKDDDDDDEDSPKKTHEIPSDEDEPDKAAAADPPEKEPDPADPDTVTAALTAEAPDPGVIGAEATPTTPATPEEGTGLSEDTKKRLKALEGKTPEQRAKIMKKRRNKRNLRKAMEKAKNANEGEVGRPQVEAIFTLIKRIHGIKHLGAEKYSGEDANAKNKYLATVTAGNLNEALNTLHTAGVLGRDSVRVLVSATENPILEQNGDGFIININPNDSQSDMETKLGESVGTIWATVNYRDFAKEKFTKKPGVANGFKIVSPYLGYQVDRSKLDALKENLELGVKQGISYLSRSELKMLDSIELYITPSTESGGRNYISIDPNASAYRIGIKISDEIDRIKKEREEAKVGSESLLANMNERIDRFAAMDEDDISKEAVEKLYADMASYFGIADIRLGNNQKRGDSFDLKDLGSTDAITMFDALVKLKRKRPNSNSSWIDALKDIQILMDPDSAMVDERSEIGIFDGGGDMFIYIDSDEDSSEKAIDIEKFIRIIEATKEFRKFTLKVAKNNGMAGRVYYNNELMATMPLKAVKFNLDKAVKTAVSRLSTAVKIDLKDLFLTVTNDINHEGLYYRTQAKNYAISIDPDDSESSMRTQFLEAAREYHQRKKAGTLSEVEQI